jgi:hypothetical protein
LALQKLLPNPAPPLLELPEPVVLVLGVVGVVAPPPAGDAPPDCEAAGAEPAEDGSLEAGVPEELEEAPEDDELGVVEEVDVVVLEVPDEAATVVEPPAGTVSVGAPVVSAEAEPPPPPQAERPVASTMPAASDARVALSGRIRRLLPLDVAGIGPPSGAEWLHPSAAVRAVIEVFLS